MVYSGASAFIPTAQTDKPATMLAKMARAIGEVPATPFDDIRNILSDAAIERVARAALQAIREPDDASVTAGQQRWSMKQYDPQPVHKIIFTAMIDAILSGWGE